MPRIEPPPERTEKFPTAIGIKLPAQVSDVLAKTFKAIDEAFGPLRPKEDRN